MINDLYVFKINACFRYKMRKAKVNHNTKKYPYAIKSLY